MSVLIVAEHTQGRVHDVTYELVAAAHELGGSVEVAVIARDPAGLDLVCGGIDTLIHVPVSEEVFDGDVYRQVLEALIADRSPEAILLGFTANSMSYAAAVAAKQGLGFASDVFGLSRASDGIVATRAFYGGKVHGELGFFSGRPVLLVIRPAAWPPAEGSCSPAVTEFTLGSLVSRTQHLEFREPPDSDFDIGAADFILAIGRGIADQENVLVFEELAEKLGATLASSRPLVDAGWMPSSRQVGQSGKTVKPKVYLAFGISGAVHHVMGMKASGTIIAVNSDPGAAIFRVANYGAVADLFDIADELEKLP